jgi:ABC-type multidrug transport system fused ATPase/permease subunit
MAYLAQVDSVIMLENGSIVEMGPYDQLIKQNGPFSTFANRQIQADQEKETEKLGKGSIKM